MEGQGFQIRTPFRNQEPYQVGQMSLISSPISSPSSFFKVECFTQPWIVTPKNLKTAMSYCEWAQRAKNSSNQKHSSQQKTRSQQKKQRIPSHMLHVWMIGEKWPHSRGNISKYSLHGAIWAWLSGEVVEQKNPEVVVVQKIKSFKHYSDTLATKSIHWGVMPQPQHLGSLKQSSSLGIPVLFLGIKICQIEFSWSQNIWNIQIHYIHLAKL